MFRKKLVIRVEEHEATKNYKCYISGDTIEKGERYYLVYIKNHNWIRVKLDYDEDAITEACEEHFLDRMAGFDMSDY